MTKSRRAIISKSAERKHMLRFVLAMLLMATIGTAAGLQPSIDVGGSLGWMGVVGYAYGHGGGGTADFSRIGFGAIAPIGKYVGLYARLADLTLWPRGEKTIEVCNRFGLIETIPMHRVSPYFKQSLVFRHGYYFEELALALGICAGVEFMSDWRLVPLALVSGLEGVLPKSSLTVNISIDILPYIRII